jgi:hypothetical protein
MSLPADRPAARGREKNNCNANCSPYQQRNRASKICARGTPVQGTEGPAGRPRTSNSTGRPSRHCHCSVPCMGGTARWSCASILAALLTLVKHTAAAQLVAGLWVVIEKGSATGIRTRKKPQEMRQSVYVLDRTCMHAHMAREIRHELQQRRKERYGLVVYSERARERECSAYRLPNSEW